MKDRATLHEEHRLRLAGQVFQALSSNRTNRKVAATISGTLGTTVSKRQVSKLRDCRKAAQDRLDRMITEKAEEVVSILFPGVE